MTKREMFHLIATVNSDNDVIVEFCNKEIERLDSMKEHKTPTKNQQENENIKTLILDVLYGVSGDKLTVSDMLKYETLTGYSNQKISALLRQLVESGKVSKVIEKKKAYFSANNAEGGLEPDNN